MKSLSYFAPKKGALMFSSLIFISKISILTCPPILAAKSHLPNNSKQVCTSDGVCRILKDTENRYGIPKNLLKAIACVESKMNPWVVNYCGKSRQFQSEGSLTSFCQGLRGRGIRNMSVGLMQLHAPSHMRRVGGLSEMVSVKSNIDYAGSLLKSFYHQSGSWQDAVKKYHGSSKRNGAYVQKVYSKWTQLKNGQRFVF